MFLSGSASPHDTSLIQVDVKWMFSTSRVKVFPLTQWIEVFWLLGHFICAASALASDLQTEQWNATWTGQNQLIWVLEAQRAAVTWHYFTSLRLSKSHSRPFRDGTGRGWRKRGLPVERWWVWRLQSLHYKRPLSCCCFFIQTSSRSKCFWRKENVCFSLNQGRRVHLWND